MRDPPLQVGSSQGGKKEKKQNPKESYRKFKKKKLSNERINGRDAAAFICQE